MRIEHTGNWNVFVEHIQPDGSVRTTTYCMCNMDRETAIEYMGVFAERYLCVENGKIVGKPYPNGKGRYGPYRNVYVGEVKKLH